MRVPKAKLSLVHGGGTILLLDDAAQARTARAENLIRRGFEVELATTVEEAESLWRPDHFVLVLVAARMDIRRAAEFCDRIKSKHPAQTVGMLVPPAAELPPTCCPDLMWTEESSDYFLARVETLACFAPAV